MKCNELWMIFVIVLDICDFFFSEVICGIEVIVVEYGYLVLIGDCVYQNQKEKIFIDFIIIKQIDGMVLFSLCLLFDVSVEEQCNLLLMVMLNEFVLELELFIVYIDNLMVVFNVVNYFYELGYQCIGCIVGLEDMLLCYYCLQGYVQVLCCSGIIVDLYYIVCGNFIFEVGVNVLEQLLVQLVLFMVVFCYSDVMVLGVLLLVKCCGLKVLDDLLIVGFDNIVLFEFCDLLLIMVLQLWFDIGCEGMLLLLE